MNRLVMIVSLSVLALGMLLILAFGVSSRMSKERFLAPDDASWLYTNGPWTASVDPSLGKVMVGMLTGSRAKIETNSGHATLKQRGSGGEIQISIDGKLAVTHAVPKDQSWHYLPIYANLTGWHKIEVAFSASNHEIGGIYIDRRADVRKPIEQKKKIVVTGASYAEGCCLDNKGFVSFSSLVGDKLDMESLNTGIGRTDVNVGGEQSGLRRVQSDVIAYKPDYVLAVYGINAMRDINSGASSHREYQADYEAYLKSITDALPNAHVFASGIISVRGMTDETLDPFNQDIKNACSLVEHCTFIDLSGKWNDDNYAKYLSRDGIHPSEEGYRFLADEYSRAIALVMKKQQSR
ncbi:SGNH/GDSL hydrolase family protein [Cohnella pontilimi]|uniref:SGNH/GDSL hydrolase family protein n=1 Tax=Cohnella pontilimi TaxID=2564100 RepID=A0A4U0FGS9_9BACL|nr:SGNH/GDSL hydrolase family protein [Cohnella pontilimi]TJY42582.1 SGNH/GDSL hydrolase family protein [Cohnella pontilimi]